MKGRFVWFCALAVLTLFGSFAVVSAQQLLSGQARLQRGLDLYSEGRWGEAIQQLRILQNESSDNSLRGEAEFWIAMSDFSAGNYNDAIHDFDEIVRIDPSSIRRFEIDYHKGRALYYLGKFEEALVLFQKYADSIRVDGRYADNTRVGSWYSDGLYNDTEGDYNRKAAALYWAAECLYSLDLLDRAESVFSVVVEQYPKSHKYEPSVNRIALIRQVRVQKELLDILKLKDSETAAAPVEESPAYDEAIAAYKEGIAPYMPTSITVEQEERKQTPSDQLVRLLAIKANALELMDQLVSSMNSVDVYGYESW